MEVAGWRVRTAVGSSWNTGRAKGLFRRSCGPAGSRQPLLSLSLPEAEGQALGCSRQLASAPQVMEPGSGTGLPDENVTCAVCRNQLRRPKLLPCLHSACVECLQNVWAEQNFTGCPICSAPSDTDVAKLQDNTFLTYLVSTLQLWQRIGSGLNTWCSVCLAQSSEESATSLCFECDQFLCLRCCESHQLLTKKYGHVVMSFNDLKELSYEEFANIEKNAKQTICQEHKEQQISFFCKTCSMGVCCHCLLLHHTPKGHSYHSIEEEVMLKKEVLKQMVYTTQESYNRFTDSYSEIMSLKERVDLMRNEIESSIKQRAIAITQEIVREGDGLLQELESEHQLQQGRLASALSQTHHVIERMRAGHRLADVIVRFGIKEELMEMFQPVASALVALQEAKPFNLSTAVTHWEFQERCLEPRELLGTFNFKAEPGEGVDSSETKEALQNASDELRAEDSSLAEEESASDSKEHHWHHEHNYSLSAGLPESPSPSSTEEVTLDADSQQPPAELVIKSSSDDSVDTDGSPMVEEYAETLTVQPEASKTPNNHGANEGGAQINGDWYQEGPSAVGQSLELRGHPLVFFKTQTMCVGGDDMVQLSAVSGEKTFNEYILPRKPMLVGIPTDSGFQMVNGVLYQHGEAKLARSLRDAMVSFLHFLQLLDLPLLVGHHIWTHDCQVLCEAWEGLHMKDCFAKHMSGFLDTLWLAKKVLPKSKVSNFKLRYLVEVLVGEQVVSHVQALQKLYLALNPTLHQAEDSQFTLYQLECRTSLQPLVDQEVVSRLIADRLAFEEISLNILELAYQSDRKSGLNNLFRASRNLGLPRIRKFTKAIGSFLLRQKHQRGRQRPSVNQTPVSR